MHTHREMYALLLVTALAFAVPWIVAGLERWARVPAVVIEILCGIVVGRTGFNVLGDTSDLVGLQMISLIGFSYLMFLSGLELDFTILGSFQLRGGHGGWRKALREPFVVALLSLAGTLVLALLGGWLLEASGLLGAQPGVLDGSLAGSAITPRVARGMLLALILTTTSLGVVLPTLKEARLLGQDYGQTILVAVMAADFSTLFLLTLTEALVRHGDSFVVSALIVLTLLLLYLGARWLGYQVREVGALQRMVERFEHGTSQIKIRGAFALVMVFVAYSLLIGTEAILGAFLAGALLSLFSQQRDSDLRQKLDAIGYGFFVPVFFIRVGLDFEGRGLLSSGAGLELVGLLVLLKAAARALPAQFLRLRFDGRRAWAAGWLLTAQLSLTIAASEIGLRLGLIDGSTNAAILLLALLTCLAGPMLFHRVWQPQPEDAEPDRVVIVGSGQIAMLLTQRLRRQGHRTVLCDYRPERLETARRLGLEPVLADPRTVDGLRAAGAAGAFALIAASGVDALNLAACRLARNVFGLERVVARRQDPRSESAYQELGVPTTDAATAMFMVLDLMAVNPQVLSLASNVADDHLIHEALLLNHDLDGRRLHTVALPGDTLVLGIRRAGTTVVPHGDLALELNDRLMLIGSAEAVMEAVALLQGPGARWAAPPMG